MSYIYKEENTNKIKDLLFQQTRAKTSEKSTKSVGIKDLSRNPTTSFSRADTQKKEYLQGFDNKIDTFFVEITKLLLNIETKLYFLDEKINKIENKIRIL